MASAWRGQALAAPVELDLFSHVAEGNGSATKIAGAAGPSEHGTRRLHRALFERASVRSFVSICFGERFPAPQTKS